MTDRPIHPAIEAMARALCFYYDTLPETAAYLERKASTGPWADRAEVRADVCDMLRAAEAAGFVLVPKESTREMVSATPTQSIHMTWEGAYRAMLAARPKIMEDDR